MAVAERVPSLESELAAAQADASRLPELLSALESARADAARVPELSSQLDSALARAEALATELSAASALVLPASDRALLRWGEGAMPEPFEGEAEPAELSFTAPAAARTVDTAASEEAVAAAPAAEEAADVQPPKSPRGRSPSPRKLVAARSAAELGDKVAKVKKTRALRKTKAQKEAAAAAAALPEGESAAELHDLAPKTFAARSAGELDAVVPLSPRRTRRTKAQIQADNEAASAAVSESETEAAPMQPPSPRARTALPWQIRRSPEA
jgi:hypothetical protein